ncbi:MAG: hypothetical protein B7Y35_02940 [Sphingomonadales bacterium 28-64-96]|nr:MAG: hypothetical protein B7Y35_02940 [Sphingomonadales bacterium 28-64-96]
MTRRKARYLTQLVAQFKRTQSEIAVCVAFPVVLQGIESNEFAQQLATCDFAYFSLRLAPVARNDDVCRFLVTYAVS